MILGTWAAAAGTTIINVVGVHEQLILTLDATVTNVVVRVMGEGVLTDINSNHELQMVTDWMKKQSPVAFTAGLYVIPQADGFIKGKNVQISITKSGAGVAGTVWGWSSSYGQNFFQILMQTALANSGINIKKFLFSHFEAFGATDRFNLTFKDGFNHQAEPTELIADNAWDQVQTDYTAIAINNSDFKYSTVNFIPAANRNVYIGRFILETSGQDLNSSLDV